MVGTVILCNLYFNTGDGNHDNNNRLYITSRFKGVASMRQDDTIASSCFRRRQTFAHLFHTS